MSEPKPTSNPTKPAKNAEPNGWYMLFWLFFTPSRWLEIQQRLLAPTKYKSLTVFSMQVLKDKRWIQRLLRQNLFFVPLILAVIVGIVVSIIVPLSVESSIAMRMANAEFIVIPAGWLNGLAFGIGFAFVAGLLFSMFYSVGMAVASAAIGLTLFGLAWGLSWDFGAIAIFGFGGGLLGRMALGIGPKSSQPAKSIGLQVATIFIGILVAVVVLLIVTTLPVVFMRGNIEDSGLRFGVIYGSILGITSSLVFILIDGYRIGFEHRRIVRSAFVVTLGCLLIGTLFGARTFLIEDLVVSIVIGMQTGIVAFTLFFIANHFAALLGGPRAGAIAAGLASGAGGVLAFSLSFNPISRPGNWVVIALIGLAGTILGVTAHLWRPIIFYPFLLIWNLFLVRFEEKEVDTSGRRLLNHSAFWDEHQWLPLIGLDDYLLMLLERAPELGQRAINTLALTKQGWAAQAAQIEHDARQLEQVDSLEAIAQYQQGVEFALPTTSAATPILRAFGAIGRDVAAALAQTSRYNQKMVLQEAEAQTNSLLFELTRNNDRVTNRFRPIGTQWLNIITKSLAQTAVEDGSEIVNPYVVGVPLTRQQQLFVGRTDISLRLEELLRHQDHPPFLLFGQRRMGKTSLLYQLRWLLPRRISAINVDMQGPVALAQNTAGFLYNFSKQVISVAAERDVDIPLLERRTLESDPFTVFDDWLDQVENVLAHDGISTLLLCLDEFEALSHAFEKGTLQEDEILGMIRHVIQHRPVFKLLLAGSHLLDEFPTWANYLINVETIQLGFLSDADARQLIENPIAGFKLAYAPDAVERVLRLTNGHPYLLQLVCAEIVNRKNEGALEDRFLVADGAEVGQVIPDVLVRGRQFFVDMAQNQFPAGTLPLMQRLAQSADGLTESELGAEGDSRPGVERLVQLGYINLQDGIYHLPIELVHHWLIQNR